MRDTAYLAALVPLYLHSNLPTAPLTYYLMDSQRVKYNDERVQGKKMDFFRGRADCLWQDYSRQIFSPEYGVGIHRRRCCKQHSTRSRGH